jgi:hypothetical protein
MAVAVQRGTCAIFHAFAGALLAACGDIAIDWGSLSLLVQLDVLWTTNRFPLAAWDGSGAEMMTTCPQPIRDIRTS